MAQSSSIDDKKDALNQDQHSLLLRSRKDPLSAALAKAKHYSLVRELETTPEVRQSTIWQLNTLAGLFSIGIAAACVVASLLILIVSDGKQVELWMIQPSVFLSVSETVCSTVIRFAFAQAVPIIWWRHAVRGRTLASLEREWAAGTSVFGALRSGKYFRLVAAASLCCVLLLATGPFLQKASVVSETVPTLPVHLNVTVSPELPTDWSGSMDHYGRYYASDALRQAYYAFARKDPIQFPVSGCAGVCVAHIQAPGLATSDCVTKSIPLSLNHLDSWPGASSNKYVLLQTKIQSERGNRTWLGPRHIARPAQSLAYDPKRESITIYSGYARLANSTGNFIMKQCWFTSAVVEHILSIRDNGLGTFLTPLANPKLIALANNTTPGLTASAGLFYNATVGKTISNVAGITFDSLKSDVTFYEDNTGKLIYNGRSLFTDQVARPSDFISEYMGEDPMDTIVAGLNEILFRGGTAAASPTQANYTKHNIDRGLNIVQNVAGNVTSPVSVFETHYRWWGGAAVIQVLCILIILPLFWGWWTLGRRVTLSPFEVAKAMETPLLREVDSNAGARGIERQVGNVKVRYGWVRGDTGYEGAGGVGGEASYLALRQEGDFDDPAGR